MKEQIADICRKVNDSIRNFRVDPINSLEYLIPIVIFLIGIINGVVTQYALSEFEKGEFHIYDRRTGREVTSAEIEWEKRKK